MAVSIKSAREVELMRTSCRLLGEVFRELEQAIKPGISTMDINNLGALNSEKGTDSERGRHCLSGRGADIQRLPLGYGKNLRRG